MDAYISVRSVIIYYNSLKEDTNFICNDLFVQMKIDWGLETYAHFLMITNITVVDKYSVETTYMHFNRQLML